MRNRQKEYLHRFVAATIAGLTFGVAYGYVANKLHWGLGYPLAIVIVLGLAYGVEILHGLSAALLYPSFEKYTRRKKLRLQMFSSLLIRTLAWLLLMWIVSLIFGFSLFTWEGMVGLAIFVVFTSLVGSIFGLVNLSRELRQKEALEEKLKALAAQAELKALKAQINPHFLFNSLNTIASLTKTSPSKAEEAIEMLADVFRYTLLASNREFVTLQNELDFLNSYLGVEKARFGDRLQVVQSIQSEILSTHIPSLILQPLVENCIKHGTIKEGAVKMEIRAFLDGNAINIEIRDRGKGAPEEIKKGIYNRGTGLRNVNERLLKIYGEGYGLKIKDNNPNGMIAMVTIPVERM